MNTDRNSLLELLSKNIDIFRDISCLVYTKKDSLLSLRSLLDIGLDNRYSDDRIGFIDGFVLSLGKYRSIEVLG